jgi:hypothetical protein
MQKTECKSFVKCFGIARKEGTKKITKLTKNESLFTNGMKNSLGQNIT